MHLFASSVCMDSWILVRQNEKSFQFLTFTAISDFAKRGATIDTPFCTYQRPESLFLMTILLLSIKKQHIIVSLREDFEQDQARTKAQTGPIEHMHPPKKCTYSPWVCTPLRHAQICPRASKRRTPPHKWRTQGRDKSPKLLDFHTSLN